MRTKDTHICELVARHIDVGEIGQLCEVLQCGELVVLQHQHLQVLVRHQLLCGLHVCANNLDAQVRWPQPICCFAELRQA